MDTDAPKVDEGHSDGDADQTQRQPLTNLTIVQGVILNYNAIETNHLSSCLSSCLPPSVPPFLLPSLPLSPPIRQFRASSVAFNYTRKEKTLFQKCPKQVVKIIQTIHVGVSTP